MRKKSSELVIHITSSGAIFFFFLFIFPHLKLNAGEFENFHGREFEDFPVQTVNSVLILENQ